MGPDPSPNTADDLGMAPVKRSLRPEQKKTVGMGGIGTYL